jgi:DNA-binding IclR family transcriptional regulator
MIDPLSTEAQRYVGHRNALRTARTICLEIGANGPGTVMELARRTGISIATGDTVRRLTDKMVQVGWCTNTHGVIDIVSMVDPFPSDL